MTQIVSMDTEVRMHTMKRAAEALLSNGVCAYGALFLPIKVACRVPSAVNTPTYDNFIIYLCSRADEPATDKLQASTARKVRWDHIPTCTFPTFTAVTATI